MAGSKKPQMRDRRGFNLIEMIVVMIVAGLMIGISAPRIKDSLEKVNVREAKVSLANYVARARGSAVARGCTTTLNIVSGAAGRIWITSCKPGDVGRNVSVDTVGTVDQFSDRFGVTLTSSTGAIAFDRRGVATVFATNTLKVTGKSYTSVTDSIRVNPIGKVLLK